MNSKVITNSNRLLPTSNGKRELAEQLFSLVKDLPIISPHGHVDPQVLASNKPFANPAELLLYFDHYITRLLHADGVDLALLRKPAADPDGSHARRAWEIFCGRWHLFAGTASAFWLTTTLETLFGIDQEPSSANAQELYEQIQAILLDPSFRPKELLKRFKIEFLATTDDPIDDLHSHQQINSEVDRTTRVAPTFRPDFYIDPLSDNWLERVRKLCTLTNQQVSHEGLLRALEIRREYFKRHGAVSVDIGAKTAKTAVLRKDEAQKLFEAASNNQISPEDAELYRANMITEMARMSCSDGLVITLHVGVFRNHSPKTLEEFGRDSGHDIPITAEFTQNLKPLLDLYGLNPNLQLILFCLDETTWSREVAPLAAFYPSVSIGAPWWFLDAPDAILRFREATMETAGFYRGSGFIDDTRAFLSIPARHEMSRRVDSAFLASLVTQGRITFEMAKQISIDLVTTIPSRAFKL